MPKNYVYILYCSDSTLYTGYTNDLAKRFSAHSQYKGAKYTKVKKRHPLKICYVEQLSTKSDALKREIAIKKLSRTEKINLIKKQTWSSQNLIQQLDNTFLQKNFKLL